MLRSHAAKLFRPLQHCSALSLLCLTQGSIWGLDGRLCPVLITFGLLTGNRSTKLQIRGWAQEFTNNLEFVFPNVSLFVVSLILYLPRTPLLVLQSETGGLLCHALISMLCLGPNGRTERKKTDKEVLSPLFPPSCWDHSSTCRRGRVPSVRVLNPYRSVTHDVTAATLGLPRVRGVRTERRGGGNGWGISISEHTTP